MRNLSPINFESIALDALLGDWLVALREHEVHAIAVLGPNAWGAEQDRVLLVVHPPRLQDLLQLFIKVAQIGAPYKKPEAPLFEFVSLGAQDPRPEWQQRFIGVNLRSLVRVEFSLPGRRAFECLLFSRRESLSTQALADINMRVMSLWPKMRKTIVTAMPLLTPRERECLLWAFEGKTARDTAQIIECSERTVIFHLANAMRKLNVENKVAAVQRACWIGLI